MKRSVLFVDDEPSVISGLQRMLHGMRRDWEMYFAISGPEALELLETHQVDVVVSDMRMPDMDGAQLLSKVMELYPATVRLLLSGYSEESTVLRSVKSAHQFISKPSDASTLKETIEKTCMLREQLKDEKLLQVITGMKELPSLPGLHYMLIKEMESPEPSLKKIADIITQDMSMTARVLQMTNSAFFGLGSKVTHVQQAVAMLGLNTLKALVLHVGFFTAFVHQSSSSFSAERLWRHSYLVSNLARSIVHMETNDPKMEEKAMVTGILHDIGILPLLKLSGYETDIERVMREEKCSGIQAEYKLIGTSHAEVGAYLLGLWGLPDLILEPVMFHHYPSRLKEDKFSILTAIHVADAWLRNHNDSYDPDKLKCLDLGYLAKVKVLNRLRIWESLYTKTIERDRYDEKSNAGRR